MQTQRFFGAVALVGALLLALVGFNYFVEALLGLFVGFIVAAMVSLSRG